MRLFKRKFATGWTPNEPDPRDWPIEALNLREAVDESKSLWAFVPQVLNQKSVSCCVGAATIGAAHIDDQIEGRAYVPLSVLFPYYNARRLYSAKLSDTGTSIRNCLKGIQKFGCPDSQYWKFSTVPLTVNRRPSWKAYAMALARRDIEYYAIQSNRIESVKAALNAGMPVIFGTALTESFHGSSALFFLPRPGKSEKIIGRHAMVIIGYQLHTQGFYVFEVLNSWGAAWGDKGRTWLHEDYVTWSETSDLTVLRTWNADK